MQNQPVTVIIPLYNRAHLIERTLESVYNQSYRPIRLIVVDNASTDASAATVTRWAETHRIPQTTDPCAILEGDFTLTLLNESRPGATIARNTGLAACHTEWLLFFDSDDCMTPNLIQSVMTEVEADPSLDIIFWRLAIVLPDGNLAPKRFGLKNILRRHVYNAQFATQAYAVRTEFFRKAGAWDPSLACWNDWELGTRLLEQSPRMKGIPEILVHIYPQEESITGVDHKSKAGRWEQAIEATEAHQIADPHLRKTIMEAMLYRRINLAALYATEGRKDLATNLLSDTRRLPRWQTLPFWRKLLLKAIYHYTRLGGRAAYVIWR